ncbi:variant erythrocyte surface antigen-1 family protein [Babesia caballi]|uniref:Variant erythrocyte surface antigen-1 family protein n=1 Tax=Babesia caballi TaxID=5871 RepID=A0AAV4LTK1_BABCB|nr:variant erythrocyte surface antigen-1 family protein [Babesia caballi]
MTASGQKKSLTDPPKDLKEAIDWVLRVSGEDKGHKDNGAIKGLTEELIKLLDKDAGEVARGVLGVMGKSITGLTNKLAQVTEQVKDPPSGTRKPFKVLVSYLQSFKGNLEKVRDYGSSVSGEDLDKLTVWLTGEPSGPIAKLAEGLGKLIGYQDGQFKNGGIGNQSEYKSAYKRDEVKWPQSPDDKRTCALIFLGIGPMLFYGLTYLYWWCEGTDGWSKLDVSGGSTTLSQFMTTIGLENKYLNNGQNTGQKVAEILKKAFANDLQHAMQTAKRKAMFIAAANANKIPNKASKTTALSAALNANPSYPLYLRALEQRATQPPLLSPAALSSQLRFSLQTPPTTSSPPAPPPPPSLAIRVSPHWPVAPTASTSAALARL